MANTVNAKLSTKLLMRRSARFSFLLKPEVAAGAGLGCASLLAGGVSASTRGTPSGEASSLLAGGVSASTGGTPSGEASSLLGLRFFANRRPPLRPVFAGAGCVEEAGCCEAVSLCSIICAPFPHVSRDVHYHYLTQTFPVMCTHAACSFYLKSPVIYHAF